MAQHLVIQLARFGDMVQTKRLLLSLAAMPGDTAHLAVDVSLAPLARIVYPFAVIHEINAHATGIEAVEAFSRNRNAFSALAEISFASVYNLNFSGMALALAGLFKPDSVRGYYKQNGQALRSRWLRMGFRWMPARRVAPLNLVDFWAYLHPRPVHPLAVNPLAKPDPVTRIAVVAAGREARRSLPPEVLAPLVEEVFAAHGGPEIVILGSNAERAFARKLARLFRPATMRKVTDFCGSTALADLPDILAGCGMVLTPDTGIMHLAAHMGVAVHAFFLSSAWCFETGPYGEGHAVYQASRACAPCVESQPCPFSKACLSPFASRELIQAVRGKEPHPWPQEILKLRTACDDLGCDCALEQGEFSGLLRRSGLRALLAEYVGEDKFGHVGPQGADAIFHEMDWMLPPEPSFGGHGRIMAELTEEE